MFFFYLQTQYCPEKCSVFLQVTLLYKMVELIIIVANIKYNNKKVSSVCSLEFFYKAL